MTMIVRRRLRFPMRAVLILICVGSLPCHLSCSDRLSPEDQIRAWVKQAATAAEERKIRSLMDLVSEAYSDDEGRDKRAIHGILIFHLRRNRSVYILHKVKDITFIDPRAAELTVAVAVAGQPIGSGVDLPKLKADLLGFDFKLQNDDGDEWRVIEAKWGPIEATEFL